MPQSLYSDWQWITSHGGDDCSQLEKFRGSSEHPLITSATCLEWKWLGSLHFFTEDFCQQMQCIPAVLLFWCIVRICCFLLILLTKALWEGTYKSVVFC